MPYPFTELFYDGGNACEEAVALFFYQGRPVSLSLSLSVCMRVFLSLQPSSWFLDHHIVQALHIWIPRMPWTPCKSCGNHHLHGHWDTPVPTRPQAL